jgi:lambda repressor-like predicted transcriptional regulator
MKFFDITPNLIVEDVNKNDLHQWSIIALLRKLIWLLQESRRAGYATPGSL